MAFDECVENPAPREYVKDSIDRTTRWLRRCKAELTRLNSLPDTVNPQRMLFGINQGGTYDDLRIERMQAIAELDLPGYAIGGLAVGESTEVMYQHPGCGAAACAGKQAALFDGSWHTVQHHRRRGARSSISLTASCRPETQGMDTCSRIMAC